MNLFVLFNSLTYREPFFHVFREKQRDYVKNIWLKGLGIGNGFISAKDQSLYFDYINSLTFVSESHSKILQELDSLLLESLKAKNYSLALVHSQKSLHLFVTEIMNLTNIYDFTYSQNFLTNHEYICYLQKPWIRRAIHAGDVEFNKGYKSYHHLNEAIMVSKKGLVSNRGHDKMLSVALGSSQQLSAALSTSKQL